MVHSKTYHKEKAKIMAPIDDFFVMLKQRMNSNVAQKVAKSKFYIKVIIFLFILTIVTSFTGIILLFKKLRGMVPLQTGLIIFFDFLSYKSDKCESIPLETKDELGSMAKTINTNISSLQLNIATERGFIDNTIKVLEDFLVKVIFQIV